MKKWFHFVSFLLCLISIFLSLNLLKSGDTTLVEMKLGSSVSIMPISACFIFDKISACFIFMVSTVSFLVLKYSYWYMGGEKKYNQFILVFFSFILAMILLSSSTSLFWVMLGWDGLGISSFCLVLFYSNWSSLNSAMITFLINRLGDFFFILSLCMFLVFYQGTKGEGLVFTVMSFFLTVAAMTKSAQVPFSAWLPAAMAAPTPVSSLVHSSTLVTAGIFLLVRFYPLLSESSLDLLFYCSSATMFVSGMSAMGEMDLKKIIALSTLSHLGFMMFFLSVEMVTATMVHLLSHAFFKSLLFMAAGVLIHSSLNNQDIRKLSCLDFPLMLVLMISISANMGIPFLSGFYSKDTVIFSFLSGDSYFNLAESMILFFSILFTCSYSFRMLVLLLKSMSFPSLSSISSTHQKMWNWLLVSSLLSSVMGGLLVWVVVEPGEELENSFLSKGIKLSIFAILVISFCLKKEVFPFYLQNSKMWYVFEMSKIFSKSLFLCSYSLLWKGDLKGVTGQMNKVSSIFMKEEVFISKPKKIFSVLSWIFLSFSIQFYMVFF